MKKVAISLALVVLVSACGRSEPASRSYGGASLGFASGPISQACLRADRKAANRRLCGCVQHVADRSLSQGDQQLAASFFEDPHRSQEVRQSDNLRHESFWKRYKAFAGRAESLCRGV